MLQIQKENPVVFRAIGELSTPEPILVNGKLHMRTSDGPVPRCHFVKLHVTMLAISACEKLS